MPDTRKEEGPIVLLEAIRAELSRLQVHAANLTVSQGPEESTALHGSLLQYWHLPASLDGALMLAALRQLPDSAGPEIVMNALVALSSVPADAGQGTTQLRLFDPASQLADAKPANLGKDR